MPIYYGHSVGRWERDMLVVDTVGFNKRSWIDAQRMPHTEGPHQVERFTRVDFDTLEYEVTIDDPGAYTTTWTGGFFLRWSRGAEIFEYICQDNNKYTEVIRGAGSAVSNRSKIVP